MPQFIVTAFVGVFAGLAALAVGSGAQDAPQQTRARGRAQPRSRETPAVGLAEGQAQQHPPAGATSPRGRRSNTAHLVLCSWNDHQERGDSLSRLPHFSLRTPTGRGAPIVPYRKVRRSRHLPSESCWHVWREKYEDASIRSLSFRSVS